jgi:hypothetical protein
MIVLEIFHNWRTEIKKIIGTYMAVKADEWKLPITQVR